VNYDTAWLLHNKILRAMSEPEQSYVLLGKIQMDDAYLPLRGSPRARAENDRAASQVEDRRARYQSLPPSRLIMQANRLKLAAGSLPGTAQLSDIEHRKTSLAVGHT